MHPTTVLAELSGQLMSVDSGEILVNDIVFMGGHLLRRVWREPHRSSTVDADHYAWQGLALDEPTDGSAARGNYQMPIGQSRLVFRPTAYNCGCGRCALFGCTPPK